MSGRPPADPRLDRTLVAAVNRGDSAAFERLYLRYRDWITRLACRFTGHHEDALDVMQETFHYFLTKFPGFRLNASLPTFFYPVVKHLALSIRRKRRPELVDDEAILEVEAPDAVDPARVRTELAAVIQALASGHREVVLLRFVDDFSLEEIAGALAIPLGTVKSRLHHALAALRTDPRTRAYFEPDRA